MPPVLTADPSDVIHGRPTSGVQFRRAVMLMLMTLVLPGSAQLVAGRKQVGRIALRIWFGLITVCLLLFGLGMLSSSFVFWLLSNTFVLGVVRLVLIVLAVGWALLFIDSWRLGDPLSLRQKQRLAMVGINGVLCFSVAGSLLFASHVVGVQKDFLSAMFTDGQATGATDGRYNVLLLGGDSGVGPVGPASRQPVGGEHRRRDRRDRALRPAAQHAQLPLPQGLDHGRAVPRRLRLRLGVRAELAVHVGRRPQEPVQRVRQPRCRGHQGRRRGHHRTEDQLLRDGEPPGLPEAGQRRRRSHPQRPRPHPDRRHRRPGLGLHRARQAQAQRLRDAVVRPLARRRRRLLADGPPEVRDERDAPPAQPQDGGAQVREDRQGQRGPDHHRPAQERGRPVHGARRSRPAASRSARSRSCRR